MNEWKLWYDCFVNYCFKGQEWVLKLLYQNLFKGAVCKIQRNLLAELEYVIRKYVFISVSPETEKCCVFVSLE